MKSVFIALCAVLLLTGCIDSDSESGNAGSTAPVQQEDKPVEIKDYPMKAGDTYMGSLGMVKCNTSGSKTVMDGMIGLIPDTEHTMGDTKFTCTL